MQRDIIVKGRSLGGTSDLTLLAPIKKGFVESLESVTYKTRVKRVLEALHGSRKATHEYSTARLLSDSVERVGVIHSVRVAVLEPDDKVMLAVTFDGNWESYIRVLWDKVGTLLDLIFCSTEDYVTAFDHSFEEWAEWGRRVQVETGFFYGPPDATAHDVIYHRRVERMRARGQLGTLQELRAVAPAAEVMTARLLDAKQFSRKGQEVADEPAYDWHEQGTATLPRVRMLRERMRNGLRGLSALHQLSELFRPGTPDGEVLRLASCDLLAEFLGLQGTVPADWLEESNGRFRRQMAWLFPKMPASKVARPEFPPPPDQYDKADLDEIPGGILEPFTDITHGAMVMIAFGTPAAARAFFTWASGNFTSARAPHAAKPGDVFHSVGVTPPGLRACGLAEEEMELFPQEFRQGMAGRAETLGDLRNNHPKRWSRPPPYSAGGGAPGIPVELDAVHAVLMLRTQAAAAVPDGVEPEDSAHPLHDAIERLAKVHQAIRILAVQGMERRFREEDDPADPTKKVQRVVDHFDYADGNGQPEIRPGAKRFDSNMVHLGELVHGYDNAADTYQRLDRAAAGTDRDKARQRWLANGSFLVVRKYRQFVHRMELAVEPTATQVAAASGLSQDEARELVYAKLMGRRRDGTPLAPGKGLNNFRYADDPAGQACPLHAHIRLAHPRDRDIMARPPRIMRRGMSYGPAHVKNVDDDNDDRGLVFMAYNASIAEQFEVVQRWLNSGNSTGASSGQSCPIVGVPENGLPRHFAFEYKPAPDEEDNDALHAFRVRLEQQTQLFETPQTLTRLQWGMYLFTPSRAVLRALGERAGTTGVAVPWEVAEGRRKLARLRELASTGDEQAAIDAWKAAIEDPIAIDRHESAALWAAIREDCGGVLATPYGTLVASRELLHEVFMDAQERYSVSGQMGRMKKSFGPISLGLDAGDAYDRESGDINRAIGKLTDTPAKKQAIFEIAFGAARAKIQAIVARARDKASGPRYDAAFDAREVVDEVLAELSEHWFGLEDGKFLRRGGADLGWEKGQPPLYPGHFTALSRYMFQPQPGAMPQELGQVYGQALREAVRNFVKEHRDRASLPQAPHGGGDAPISEVIFRHELGQRETMPAGPYDEGDDFVARTMVGVLMGFNPTIIGATLNVLREWQRDGTVGVLRGLLGAIETIDTATWRRVHDVLMQPMSAAARMRPMPQIAWRTVRKPHRLAAGTPHAVDLAVDDKVVLAIVSGTQQSLAESCADGLLMFGGDRRDTPHPTHACPGYEAGIEAMLGALAAIVSVPGDLQNGFGWLNFLLEGDVEDPVRNMVMIEENAKFQIHGASIFKSEFGLEPHVMALADGRKAAREQRLKQIREIKRDGLVLCWGDSWLAYELVIDLGTDLRDRLERFKYHVPSDFCSWHEWRFAQTMARDASIERFCAFLSDQLQTSAFDPKAVVLSCGGNDAVGDTLTAMLNPKGTQPPLNDKLGTFLGDLAGWYVKILRGVRARLVQEQVSIPIITHGYEFPYPSLRLLIDPTEETRKWMYIPFFQKSGYQIGNPDDVKEAHNVMTTLIKALNKTLSDVANLDEFKGHVRHVDLTGTFDQFWDHPIDAWSDGLHPGDDGFSLLAAKIDAAIQSVAVAGPGA